MPRVNTTQAFRAWQEHRRARPAPSIWTNGDHVLSYSTEIACRMKDGSVALLTEKFSVTTTQQQNGLRQLCQGAGLKVREFQSRTAYTAAVTEEGKAAP